MKVENWDFWYFFCTLEMNVGIGSVLCGTDIKLWQTRWQSGNLERILKQGQYKGEKYYQHKREKCYPFPQLGFKIHLSIFSFILKKTYKEDLVNILKVIRSKVGGYCWHLTTVSAEEIWHSAIRRLANVWSICFPVIIYRQQRETVSK